MSSDPAASNMFPPRVPRVPHTATSLPDRHFSRFGVHLPVRCTPLRGRVPRILRGRTANVSGGGLAVDLPVRLPPHTHVTVEIETGVGPLRMEADVLWTRRLPEKTGVTRHGLCLPDQSGIMDLPIHALLGEWLQGLAKQEEKELGRKRVRAPGRARRPTRR